MTMTEERPSRRERRRIEVRDRILQTGSALFESKGYEATTVSEIAGHADIAYGTFFNHFPSKLDLLRELADIALREFFQGLEDVSKQPGCFADHLATLFEGGAAQAESAGEPMRQLLGAMTLLAFPESAVTDDRRIRLAFRRFLEEGFASGEIRDDVDLDTATEVVVGTWYSVFLSWVHFDHYPLRERASAAARFLARALGAPGAQES
jgi:AcrR family transcriptional regulator